MAACLGRLRWTPEAFWRATPREVAAALRPVGAARRGPLPRAAFETLMQRYPDGGTT